MNDTAKEKLISIIIPCYNVESYIDRCFQSLVNQTLGISRLEILFVDDCSTDHTWDKLEEYESAYPQDVSIIHLEHNIRQGGARNVGMKYASCEYTAFIDSDDWIEPDMFEKLYSKAQSHHCDMVSCRHWRDPDDPSSPLPPQKTGQPDSWFVFNDNDQRKEAIVKRALNVGVWGRIFRSSFLSEHNFFFPEHVVYEDLLWEFLEYLHVENAYNLEERLYHYRINTESTVLKKNQPYHYDILEVSGMIWDELQNRNAFKQLSKEMEFYYLMDTYLIGMKIFLLRFDPVPYSAFLQLKEDTLSRIPECGNNPYLSSSLTEIYQLLVRLLYVPVQQPDLDKIAAQFRIISGV